MVRYTIPALLALTVGVANVSCFAPQSFTQSHRISTMKMSEGNDGGDDKVVMNKYSR